MATIADGGGWLFRGEKVLCSESYATRLCVIMTDEAHTVLNGRLLTL